MYYGWAQSAIPASGTSKHGHMTIFDKSEADVTHESCGICSRVGRLIYLNVQQVWIEIQNLNDFTLFNILYGVALL